VCRHEVANGGYCEDETNAPEKHLAMQKRSHVAHLFANQNLMIDLKFIVHLMGGAKCPGAMHIHIAGMRAILSASLSL